MAQEFSLRYPLIDGQGNFGSVDGDNAAAYALHRVPAASASPTSSLADIDKETVDFVPNYDGKEQEPSVLPSQAPEPAGQRLVGHRRRHGDEHPAAQPRPRRSTGCLALLDKPEITRRRADGASSRRPTFRRPASSTASKACARATAPAAGACVIRARTHVEDLERGRPAGDHRRRDAVPGEQGDAARAHRRARPARRSSRASPTCATSPTGAACASSSS